MPMSNEMQQAALAKMESLWKQPRRCPVCEGSTWDLCPLLLEMPEFGASPDPAHRSVAPAIAIMCKLCGYTLLFNAMKLGLLSSVAPGPSAVSPYPPGYHPDSHTHDAPAPQTPRGEIRDNILVEEPPA